MSLSNDNYLGAEKTTLRHKTAMVKSNTQNPSLGTSWRVLKYNMISYNILYYTTTFPERAVASGGVSES